MAILTGKMRPLGWCTRIPDNMSAKNSEPKLLLPQAYKKINEMLLFIWTLINNLHFFNSGRISSLLSYSLVNIYYTIRTFFLFPFSGCHVFDVNIIEYSRVRSVKTQQFIV